MMYLDASAAAKLVFVEEESAALVHAVQGQELCSSAILSIELHRAARRRNESSALVAEILEYISTVEIVPAQLRIASSFEAQHLGALDAIHLATALLIDADALVTYDKPLADAASAAGLRVVSPA